MTEPVEKIALSIVRDHDIKWETFGDDNLPPALELRVRIAAALTAERTAADERVVKARDELVSLLADKHYLRHLADYCTRGHLSHYGWLKSKDGGLIDEILARTTAAQAPQETDAGATKPTVEDLDVQQFGRVLHSRPATPEGPGTVEGWQLVPKVPTREMREAGAAENWANSNAGVEDIYSAMLAAAPAPLPAQAEGKPTLSDDARGKDFVRFVHLWLTRDNVSFEERKSVILNHPIMRAALSAPTDANPARGGT